MQLTGNKHNISFFFIIAFFLLKVVNLHVFEHISNQQDDFRSCEICALYTISEHHNPITFTSETPEFTPPVFPITEHLPAVYVVPVPKIRTRGEYFNKPPPYLS